MDLRTGRAGAPSVRSDPVPSVASPSVPYGVVAAAIVVAGVVGLELAHDASLADILRYLAYELGFILLPGWLVYRAVSDRPGGPLRQLAIGWALGYVLEIGAFALTAAIGRRGLFVLYPPVAMGVAVAVLRRRRRTRVRARHASLADPEPPPTGRFVAALVGVCLMAVAVIGVTFFDSTPLPGTESVRISPDFAWAISIAAEAKHHWPIEDPSISGETFPYHYFVHIHWAAASQVTGIDLSTIFSRLWILPLTVLLVLELVVAGQSLARSRQAGLIAACLTLFVGQLQVDASRLDAAHVYTEQLPFLGVLFSYLVISPSYLFGLVMFLPLILLIGERLRAHDGPSHRGAWALVALFAIGASDAKIVLLPLVAGGLVLFALWSWLTRRFVPRALWIALAIILAVLGAIYVAQYRGHASGLSIDPLVGFDFFRNMPLVGLLRAELADWLPGFPGQSAVLSSVAFGFGAFGLLVAPLIGLVWILRRQGLRLDASQAWLLALFGAGLGALMVLTSIAGNQLYFFFTALVAGCLLSGQGLWMAWQSRPPLDGAHLHLASLGGAAAVGVAAVLLAPTRLDLFQSTGDEAAKYFFLFAGLFVCLGLVYVAARRWAGPTRWTAAALVCGVLLAVGALDTPVKRVLPTLEASDTPEAARRLTPELHGALTWLRDETPTDTVIAVNNQMTELGPYEFTYGAFAERRVFLGGWGYSNEGSLRTADTSFSGMAEDSPYADRLARNVAAFAEPTPDRLQELRDDYGVQYLVVDGVTGGPADLTALRDLATPVYEADGVTVFQLD